MLLADAAYYYRNVRQLILGGTELPAALDSLFTHASQVRTRLRIDVEMSRRKATAVGLGQASDLENSSALVLLAKRCEV